MWQKAYEKYSGESFTVVGIALDVEGIGPAKRYYEKHGVTFPALVDPNYATGFGAVPKTFFVDEHGVVQELDGWRKRLQPAGELKPVTEDIRAQWSEPGQRLEPSAVAGLLEKHRTDPADLHTAVELASRYADLSLSAEARGVLQKTLAHYEPKEVTRSGNKEKTRLLGEAYLQLARAWEGERAKQVEYATLSFYLHPTVGFGKQIARIIAPEKFDGRPDGSFDNEFREGTLKRLRRERRKWLAEDAKTR